MQSQTRLINNSTNWIKKKSLNLLIVINLLKEEKKQTIKDVEETEFELNNSLLEINWTNWMLIARFLYYFVCLCCFLYKFNFLLLVYCLCSSIALWFVFPFDAALNLTFFISLLDSLLVRGFLCGGLVAEMELRMDLELD